MKIVLGLGNPGSRYARTRHNVGWMALDIIAERLRTEFQPGVGDYYAAEGSWRGRKVVLIKPTTWMNNSGLAARQVVRHYSGSPEELLVLVDEVQFPVGKIKLTPSGSSGGHNGLESLLYELGTENFPRLRLGVGNDFGPGEMVDYVLSTFKESEGEELGGMLNRAKDATLLWIAEGTAKAMNQVNARKREKSSKESATNSPKDDTEKSVADSNIGQSDNNISTKS
ncbi:MAG: aminoacyl-tRNA hydrolase [Candidatus Kapaibacterium sp.]